MRDEVLGGPMNDLERETYDRLLSKSCEAFVMAIELYNKPSLKYRVEGFAFFACNAWELMLKARIIDTKGMDAIYYKDNPGRTKSLETCIDMIFTNTKSPMNRNLKSICKLRNTSTHFIVEEHEQMYVGLFQACVNNFEQKMFEFHGISMADHLPAHFLMLSMSASPFNPEAIRAKYAPEIAEKFLFDEAEVEQEQIIQESPDFAVIVKTELAVVKNPKNADFTVAYDSSSNRAIRTAKVFQDPSTTHPLSASKVIDHVNKTLERRGIVLSVKGNPKSFTSNDWKLFMKFYGIKDDPSLTYRHEVSNTPSFSYSMKAVDMIVDMIKGSPDTIIDDLKSNLKKKNEGDPRGKGF